MAIAKMALVSIAGDLGQLDDVIMQCLGSGAFHPEPPLQAAGGIRGFTPLAEENPYGPLLAKITDAGVAAGLTPHYDPGGCGRGASGALLRGFLLRLPGKDDGAARAAELSAQRDRAG